MSATNAAQMSDGGRGGGEREFLFFFLFLSCTAKTARNEESDFLPMKSELPLSTSKFLRKIIMEGEKNIVALQKVY